MRWVEMHDCPAWLNPATRILSAADSQLPSGSMITGALLPSSRPTFFRGARALMPQPTSGEPVKVISAMSGSSTIALPTVTPPPVVTFRQELGQRDRRQRGLRRRLEHHRAAGGDRGRELVRDQVQREVERTDGADHADR